MALRAVLRPILALHVWDCHAGGSGKRVGALSSCFVMHSPCLLWSILGQAGLDACATLVHAMAAGRKNDPLLGISALFLWLLPSQSGALGVWWHMSSGQKPQVIFSLNMQAIITYTFPLLQSCDFCLLSLASLEGPGGRVREVRLLACSLPRLFASVQRK